MSYDDKEYDMGMGDGRDEGEGGSKPFGGKSRRKVCRFCNDQDMIMDYKDTRIIQSFLTEHGKIVPQRISGNCARHQRAITSQVKRARILALVGFVSVY